MENSVGYVHAIMNIVMAVSKDKALVSRLESAAFPMILRSLSMEGRDSVDFCIELATIMLINGG